MRICLRFLMLLLIGVCTGCFGGTQNPSYFPYLLPTGDIIRTHAKPGGLGYFRNFDPKAVKLDVTPKSRVAPTRTQQVLIATVVDKDNTPRRKRRVEWLVEGPGSIIEVDESGFLPGRGYKVDNKYAVSYTDYVPHTLTRGNTDTRDDIEIQPGQTWCVISSAVEGKTSVTVYAPEVHEWDNGRQYVTLEWRDAPFAAGPSLARSGTGEIALDSGPNRTTATTVSRTPGLSLELKMPPSVGIGREFTASIVLSNGNATDSSNVTIGSEIPDGAEFVRADPLPTQRTGNTLSWKLDPVPGMQARSVNLVLKAGRAGTIRVPASARTADNLNATTDATIIADVSNLAVKVDASSFATAGAPVPVNIRATNTGAVPIENAIAWIDVPSTLVLQGSSKASNELPVGRIEVGQNKTVTASLVADRSGSYPIRVNLTADGGLSARDETTIRVSRTEIAASITGPKSVMIAEQAIFDVTVTNPGDVPLRNATVRATVPASLKLKDANSNGKIRGNMAEWTVATIPVNGRSTLRLTAVGDRIAASSNLGVSASVAGDGSPALEAQATASVSVAGQPNLSFEVEAPKEAVSVGRKVTYRTTIRNNGTDRARDVLLSLEFSPEMSPSRTTGPANSIAQVNGNQVEFPATEIAAGASVVYLIEAQANTMGNARVSATVQSKDLNRPLREEQPTQITR